MSRAAIGCVVVTEDDRPIGIVTDRDIALRVVAQHKKADGRIDDVMTTNPVVLEADSDLREAITIFTSHPFRRLPLVRDGRFLGMLTSDAANLVRPVTGQVVFGHPEVPAPAAVVH
jgi:CBS domain-containing protein